jgi:hypothetical protein
MSTTASFVVAPIEYPRTHDSAVRFVAQDRDYLAGDHLVCHTCSFRPWAEHGEVAWATVTIERATGTIRTFPARLTDATDPAGGRWTTAPLRLRPGDRVFVAPGGVVDRWGETNGLLLST